MAGAVGEKRRPVELNEELKVRAQQPEHRMRLKPFRGRGGGNRGTEEMGKRRRGKHRDRWLLMKEIYGRKSHIMEIGGSPYSAHTQCSY